MSIETAFKVEKLIEHIGGADEINPQGDNTDDYIGAFLMYVIKDYAITVGLIEDKKVKALPGWKVQLTKYKYDFFSEKQKYLS
jgi:hypothetical protein